MKLIIVTGLSGSGKSSAMDIFEDLGYYCIDNLPPALLKNFVEIATTSPKGGLEKVAVGIDARGFEFEESLRQSILFLTENRIEYEIVFLEASDEVIVRRYKFTRRIHPLKDQTSELSGIKREREMLGWLRSQATYIIDTSDTSAKDLHQVIVSIYQKNQTTPHLNILVTSFGFKYGLPIDADLVFDVRFMPNPYYINDLKELTGNDKQVAEYVMNSPLSVEFAQKLNDFIDFLVPRYIEEGKSRLVIAIGCTGGHHRSVTIANALFQHLKENGYNAFLKHRDIRL